MRQLGGDDEHLAEYEHICDRHKDADNLQEADDAIALFLCHENVSLDNFNPYEVASWEGG
jgi:hypothetical protein